MQRTIREIKADREIGERYMLLQDLLKDEKKQGRMEETKEHILSLLKRLGVIPERMRKELEEINNLEILRELFDCSVEAKNLEAFEAEMNRILASGQEK